MSSDYVNKQAIKEANTMGLSPLPRIQCLPTK